MVLRMFKYSLSRNVPFKSYFSLEVIHDQTVLLPSLNLKIIVGHIQIQHISWGNCASLIQQIAIEGNIQ